jgi:iron-sulfur cluster repair protein YtfE (RIC family)
MSDKTDRMLGDERGIFHQLVTDHRKLDSLFEEITSGNGDADRLEELFQALKLELMAHTNVEDRVVYMTFEQHGSLATQIEEAREDHQRVEAMLLEIDGMEIGDDSWLTRVEELRDELDEHIDTEENQLIPQAFDLIDESSSREMARLFQEEKETELTVLAETEPMIAVDDLDALSRDELYDRAAARGIEGRSQMSKEELAEALRQQG